MPDPVKVPLPVVLGLKVTVLRVMADPCDAGRAAAESKYVPVVTTSVAFPVAVWMAFHVIVAA
jgi:hypothetical protein